MLNKTFDFICYRCIEREINNNVISVSVPEISQELGYSQNLIRKEVKRLKELELVEPVCTSGFNEKTDKYVVVRGYKVTDKGKGTETYQKNLYSLAEM